MIEQFSVMADHRSVVIPAAASRVRKDPLTFKDKGLGIPNCPKIIFAQRADPYMLLQAREDIAPGIDSHHKNPGIASVSRKVARPSEAFDEASEVPVPCHRSILDLLGDYSRVDG
jgi:hypothetical protein